MQLPFDPFPTLLTDRLHLRRLVPADAPALLAIRSDPRVNAYLNRPLPASLAEMETRIETLDGYIQKKESIMWAVSLAGETEMIGTICLWHLDAERNAAELGFEVMPEHGGKGLMKEAARAVVNFGFEKMQLSAIDGWTHRDNTASQKLMEKIGFTRSPELEEKYASELGEDKCVIYTLMSK